MNLYYTMGEFYIYICACNNLFLFSLDQQGRDQVRGIIVDMSEMEEMPLDNQAFVGMSSLRYIKVYNSLYPRHCEARCKLNLPDELEFPKDNIVRYLDWMNFPEKELPSDFEPKNLIDLRLPYSKIISVWNCVKVCISPTSLN